MSAPTSRLVRKEKSRLVKQTVMFGGLAIGLIVVFIFVILPLFIVILNKVINTDPFPEAAKIELQAPLLNAPVNATNSAELVLSGFAQPKAKVTLLLNAKESSSTTAGDDGAFELPLSLGQGENTIAVFSSDETDASSPNSQEFVVLFDNEAPKIVVDEPQPEAHFDRKSRVISIRGLTDIGSKAYINDRLVFVSTDGTFTTSVSLGDNKNEIKVAAVDSAGNRTEQILVVYLDV